MVDLNIDFKRLLPYVIDAFSNVYGEEYHDIISERINNAIIIQYHDCEGLRDYLLRIDVYKRRQFAVEFLYRIGIDVKRSDNNYTQPLAPEIEEILSYYIGSSYYGFSEYTDIHVPLQAFKTESEMLLSKKLAIINYLLGDDFEKIDENNFESFIKTEKYDEILGKVQELNGIYEELLFEYKQWISQFDVFQEYIDFEKQRKKEIYEQQRKKFIRLVYNSLPSYFKNKVQDQEEDKVLGIVELWCKTSLEYFDSKTKEKLISEDVSLFEKECIISFQKRYLQVIGKIPDFEIECNSKESIKKYLNFLERIDVDIYLPQDEVVQAIEYIRKKFYEDSIEEYYKTKSDVIDAINKLKFLGTDNAIFEWIYEYVKSKNLCVTTVSNGYSKPVTIMFYTIIPSDYDLSFLFLHECGHIIDLNLNGCGFEPATRPNGKCEKNPYDDRFRKYERFNETINDIFSLEALELLQSQGIYLIEKKEFSCKGINKNSYSLIRDLLKPLLSKFRQQVIRAKINGNIDELTKYIGKDNFEELVDVVNKVDSLINHHDLTVESLMSPDNIYVKEYYQQLVRIQEIYKRIDNHYEEIKELPIYHL